MMISRKEAESIIRKLQNVAKKYRIHAIPAGGYRRGKEFLKDIDLIVIYPRNLDHNNNPFMSLVMREFDGIIPKLRSQGRREMFLFPLAEREGANNISVDVFYVKKQELPFALFHYTGNRTYNIQTRVHAKSLGLKLNQYGIFDGDRRAWGTSKIKTERQICRYLGITYKAPEDRSV